MKSQKQKELEQLYMNDEISEQELEEELVELLQSEETEASDVVNDWKFVARSFGQIIAAILLFATIAGAIAFTMGRIVPLLIIIAAVLVFVKALR